MTLLLRATLEQDSEVCESIDNAYGKRVPKGDAINKECRLTLIKIDL